MSVMENKSEIIIIVDDNLTNLNIAKNHLKDIYSVFTVLSGNKLFQLLENVNPDLILLDIAMPDMDGFEIAEILKKNKKTENIPIIFLTSKFDLEDEVKGLSLGAVDYITKPSSKELLIKRVGIHLLLEKQKKDMYSALEKNEIAVHALKEAQITTSAVFNSNPQGNILFDSSFKVIDCNPAAMDIMGFKTKEELLSGFYGNVSTIMSDIQLDSGQLTESMNERFVVASKKGSAKYEIELQVKNNKKSLIVELKKIPYEGNFAIILYAYDISEIRRQEKELLRVHEQNTLQLAKLNMAIGAMKMIIWDMDFDKDNPLTPDHPVVWSDSFRQLLGYSDETDFPNKLSSFQMCIHQDEQERAAAIFKEHMLDKSCQKPPYDEEFRFVTKSGKIIYLRITGIIQRDIQGNPIHYSGGIMDISESKYLIQEIDSQRLNAETANERKNIFLANMSYEMRTPLNAVLGLVELSLDSQEVNDENYSNLEKIKEAGMTLLNIVNDVLDISKITTGKFSLIPDEYETPSLINDAVTQSSLHMKEKHIRFILNIDDNFPSKLYGDELRIKQIISNLLSNAFKYTMEGKVELTIGFDKTDDFVWMTASVRDTGIGIRQEDISGLFDDYVQMDMSSHRKVMGTGLGLPIAKRLAESMNGDISVESEYGKGSVFTMRIQQKYLTDEVIGPKIAENLKNLNYFNQKRRFDAGIQKISLPYAKVLIVDDMVTNLDVAKGLMKRYNMKIDCLTSGQEAIKFIRDENIRYNAIFMDHMMPGMDGIEATRLIREIGTDYAKNIPIIALTANAVVGNEEMFFKNGFQAFISKPIELARLDAVIREWIRDKHTENFEEQPDLDTDAFYKPEKKYKADWRALGENAGLNIEKGIERFGGDEQSYINILKSYLKNTPALLEKIRTVNEDLTGDYAIIVHGIKGTSRSIYADETAGMAENLEISSKNGDYDYIKTHNETFIKTAQKLLSEIEKILEQLKTAEVKIKKDRPDKAVLAALREACVQHDIDHVDEIIAELDNFEYDSGGDLVIWLQDNADQMNYDEIAKRLSAEPDR